MDNWQRHTGIQGEGNTQPSGQSLGVPPESVRGVASFSDISPPASTPFSATPNLQSPAPLPPAPQGMQELPMTPQPPSLPKTASPSRFRAIKPLLRTIALAVAVVLVLVSGIVLFNKRQQANNALGVKSDIGRFNALELPLDELVAEGALSLGSDVQTLTINGKLRANNTLVIAPTDQPSQATAGQIYYNQTSNELAYFNGTAFVPLSSSVQSIGGATGAIAVGGGLSLAGGTLGNTGVLSVQGQTGAVAFSAGSGISVDGTTFANTGVLSVSPGTPNLAVANDGNGNLVISNVGGGTGTITSTGGTPGQIAKFTSDQNIEDSLLSEAAGTVTANGNVNITGGLSLGTALSVINGGTGTTALTTNGVVLGQGTGALTTATAGASGLCLMSTVGAPTFQACPGSGGGGVTSLNGATGALSIANATEAGGVITINDASTSQKGVAQFNATNFTVSSGTVNTIQNIDPTANPTFAGINTSAITPNGTPLVVGSTTQDLTLQGSNVLLSRTVGANTSTLSFVSPTANVTYRLQTAAAGTYDVCTTVGNCVGLGGGVSTVGGTTNRLAKFTGSQAIGDSLISDDGTLVTVNGNLSVTGTVSLTTPLAVTNGGTGAVSAAGARGNLGAAASGANSDITSLSGLTTALSVVQGGTGASALTANGVLLGNGTSPVSSLVAGGSGLCLVSTAGTPTWQSCPGGGGVSSLNGLSGALTIANASAAGSTITLDNASTSQKGIASFNSTNFTVTSGAVNTVQNIDITAAPTFGRLTLSSSQASSPMLLVNNTNGSATGNLIDLQLGGSSKLAVSPAGNMTLSGTINGQTINSSANFSGSVAVAGAANLNGGASVTGTLNANTITPTGAMTIGATAQNLTLQGASTTVTSTNAGNTTTLAFQTPTANVTYRLQTAAAGTYDICTTVGNCAGVGGGVTTSGGTTNTLAKFTGSQAIGDSIITDDGSTVAIAGDLAVNTITPTGAMTIGATSQNLTLQGATTTLTATDSGITNSLSFATPTGSNKAIVIPDASGTLAVSASGPLQLDAAGNITCPNCVTSGGGGGGQSAVDSLNGLTGALAIANASGSGGTVTINDASTSQKGIAQFNSTNFNASGGIINTIQDINTTAAPTFGRLNVTSSQATNDMMVVNNTNASGTGSLLKLQLNGSNRFTVDPAGNVVANGTITSGNINGQTISSSANFTGTVAVASTLNVNTITPTGAMTIGATAQNLTLQGATTTISSTNSGNTTTLALQTPTANVTYRLLTASAGTYDICTTAGNCAGVGGGVTTGGGTTNFLPKFTGAQTIGDSNISDDGSTVTIGVDLAVNTITPDSAMTIGATSENLTLQGAVVNLTATNGGITNNLAFATPSGSNKTITLPNASGTVAVSASGPLAIDAAGNITCATCVTGAAVSSLNGQTGAVTIANASGSGGTVTINDASTSQKGIASFNSTNFSASGGVINTIQDINTTAAPTFGRLTITSNQASNNMLTINNTNTGASGSLLKVQLNSADRFTVDAAGNVVANGTITSGNINGQTISSAANFTGSVAVATTLNVNTITPNAAMTIGATNQNLTLQGASTAVTASDSGNKTTLTFQTPTANVTYRLLTTTAGTYDICTTVGNCAGVGGGVTTSGGTTNRLAKFTGSQAIGDSIISDNGTTVTIAGGLSLNSGNTYQINGVQISSANLSNDSNLAKLSPSQTFTGSTNIFKNGSDSASAFVVQNAAGRSILNVDTSGAVTTLGNITSTVGQGVAGALRLADGTNDNFGMTLNTTTLTASRTISLPDAAGTVCLQNATACGFAAATGSANYIQNQTGTNQTADFQISGTGRANTSLLTPLLDTASAVALDIGTTNATSINLNENVVVASGKTLTLAGKLAVQPAADATDVINVKRNGGANLLTVDSSNGRVGINLGGSNLPGYALDVGGDINTSTALRIGGTTICTSSGCTPTGGGSYIQNTTTVQTNASIAIQSANDADVTMLLKERATQSADILKITNSNNDIMFNINTYGILYQDNSATFNRNVGIGGPQSTGEQLRINVADTNTIGFSIYGDNSSQNADLINIDGAGSRALKYTGAGTLAVTAGSGQTADIVSITNSGNPTTTAGVEGLNINFTGGAAAVESSGMRVDLTPGTTSGGTWSGMRVVANSTGATSGVSEYGIKVEGPGTPGAGAETGINVTSGWDIGVNISSGGLQLATQSDASAPAANTLRTYARNFAGRSMIVTRDNTNLPTALQPAIFQKNIVAIYPDGGNNTMSSAGSPIGIGDWADGFGGTASTTSDQNSGWVFETGTTATAGAGTGTGENAAKWFRGNVNGSNGFFTHGRFYFPDASYNRTSGTTGSRIWYGMSNHAATSAWFTSDNPATGTRAGFSYVNSNGRLDTNWQFTTRDGTTQALQDTGMAFAPQKEYDLYIFCPPQCSTMYWRIDNLTDGTTQEGSTSSNLPGTGTGLRMSFQLVTVNATARKMSMQSMYAESDR